MTAWARRAPILLVLLPLGSACATASSPDGAPGGVGISTAPSAPKTLTIALEDEPLNLATLLDTGSSSAGEIRHIVHSRLAKNDDRGNFAPELATELPSQERGTWTVRPDGTMQTTYKLREGVTWHDGTPLLPQDFILAFTMTLITLGRSLSLEQAPSVRDQWGAGRIEVTIFNWFLIQPQMFTPSPGVVGNAQFRRAMMYAIDRQEMSNSLQDGLAPVAQSFIRPAEALWKEIEPAVVKYDYDPRRAAQILEGLGYAKGADGCFETDRISHFPSRFARRAATPHPRGCSSSRTSGNGWALRSTRSSSLSSDRRMGSTERTFRAFNSSARRTR